MAHKELFWMTCDSVESTRAEYGPFANREQAEAEARKLGFFYLLRYEHVVGDNDEIEDVHTIFIELPGAPAIQMRAPQQWHTRCATCGEAATHPKGFQAEVWADIHEFEHSRHKVRLFERTSREGLREVSDWRAQ